MPEQQIGSRTSLAANCSVGFCVARPFLVLRRYVIGYFPTRLDLLSRLTLHLACLSLSAQLRAALDKNSAPRSLPTWSPLGSSIPPPLVLPASCRRTRPGRLGPGDRPLCQPSRCSFRSGQRILQQHPGEVIETTLKNLWSGSEYLPQQPQIGSRNALQG